MNPDIVAEFERQNHELGGLFRQLSGRRVHYFPNYGNAGDSLIAAATYQLLDHYRISYDLHTTPEEAAGIRDDIVLLGGGGNLIPLYKGMANLLRAAAKGNNRTYLLPHSVRGHERLLASLPPSVTIFCREAMSYQYVQFTARKAQVVLGHDLGLFLDPELLAQHDCAAAARERFTELLRTRVRMTPETLTGRHVSCIRGGVEATVAPEGDNFDISVIFKGHVTPGEAEFSAWMLHEFVRLAGEITSNRLHVCIAAALAGTPVNIHDNNYGKVSGVYLQSMRDRFPKAKFVGEMIDSDPFAAAPESAPVPVAGAGA